GVAHAGTMAFGVGDPDAFASADPDACVLYGLAEERRRLAAAIAKLAPRLQEVLGLYYQHDCTQAEIGRLLGITESRVCQLLAESVVHLRKTLRERVAASEPS
ncbi:MAG: sigma-70 family RNA polymerase sigma factor, partial [Deltaproteobacteria bacterium]|nr:sigma-70 family RNA polymerase sigma factor [Deltaproteobacteria bacterium]